MRLHARQGRATAFYVASAWIMAIADRLGFSVDFDGDLIPLLVVAAVQLLCVVAFGWSLWQAVAAAYRGEGSTGFLWPLAGALAVLGAVAIG